MDRQYQPGHLGKVFPSGGLLTRPDLVLGPSQLQALSILCRAKPFPTRSLRLSHYPFVNILSLYVFPDHVLPSAKGGRFGCAASWCAHPLVLLTQNTQGEVQSLLRASAWNGSIANLSDALGVDLHNLVELVARAYRYHHIDSLSPFTQNIIYCCFKLRPLSLCSVIEPCTIGRPMAHTHSIRNRVIVQGC
ncbi:hypothetical protein EVAR_27356_1 [Eumeta japonica]|uniref:Uncharacterized protein n=1 Tax=Eumeta variegata TaxID=151549 RepID=A0A4C1UCG4_EUMVA|nr:hypothetical protein EVAR_27356_1 [Eumeta japonica]